MGVGRSGTLEMPLGMGVCEIGTEVSPRMREVWREVVSS